MPSVNEPVRTALGAALKAGVDTISLSQQLTFTLYKRLVLPLDGYLFWVKASILVPDPLPDVRKTFMKGVIRERGLNRKVKSNWFRLRSIAR